MGGDYLYICSGPTVLIKGSIDAKLSDFLINYNVLNIFLMTYARVGYGMSFMTHELP
jgi:hypothetical protein